MSEGGPGGNPFEGMPFLGDLAKLFSASGPVNWELAKQTAASMASEGRPEANVDPLERIELEELARVAELHVEQQTGFPLTPTGRTVRVEAVTRGEWARRTLDAYRPTLERLATGLTPDTSTLSAALADDIDLEADPGMDAGAVAGFLGELTSVLNPVLLGMQTGFMVGHLSQSAFGQYDLPIPRDDADTLLVVPANVHAFAEAWSVPADDLRLWLLLSELTHHAVLSRPHVRDRILGLLGDSAAAFQRDPTALADKLGAIDPADPESFQRVLGDPKELLGAIRTPIQTAIISHLSAVVAALEGYVDHVLDTVGARLISSYPRLTEALRRNRVQRGEGERFVEQLLGLELGQDQFDRGSRFVDGIVERAGEEGLARLWRSERELPTPAEVDAPGLWLARIDLPHDGTF